MAAAATAPIAAKAVVPDGAILVGDAKQDGNGASLVSVFQVGEYATVDSTTLPLAEWNRDRPFHRQTLLATMKTGKYRRGLKNQRRRQRVLLVPAASIAIYCSVVNVNFCPSYMKTTTQPTESCAQKSWAPPNVGALRGAALLCGAGQPPHALLAKTKASAAAKVSRATHLMTSSSQCMLCRINMVSPPFPSR